MHQHEGLINLQSSPRAKVRLFRSLFLGREDVYARRFVSRKTGRAGYSPACANEWVAGLCEKPRVKCRDCKNRRFLPVTDEVVGQHLAGKDRDGRDFVMGVYPMLLDETCFFLAVDFDKAGWRDDAKAFLETCQRMKLPAALERSRSGNGGHLWLFFDAAIPARLARDLGSHILTETMERRPDIGLDSYDRFFPNQDTLPRAGFGNLIALPLQKQPRVHGNSVFLDQNLEPYADQWSFLASISRISQRTAEDVVCRAERKRRVVGVRRALPDEEENAAPWSAHESCRRTAAPIAGDLPDKLKLILGNDIYIAKKTLPPDLRNRLVRLAAFQNPEFYKAQAMRLPTYDKPRIITCAEDHPHHLALPRGCLDDVQQLLRDLKVEPIVQDQRYAGERVDFAFHGHLRSEQMAAANAIIAHDTGVLSAATAFGKTVIAAWLTVRRGVNTLVLVHRRQLLEQWIERLSEFLALSPKTIGRIGAGRKKPTGILDVATVQSLVRNGVVDGVVRSYGHLIVDECHHLPARSFELAARQATAKFVTGLTATAMRKDGHHPIIFMQCGPIRYRVDAKQQADARPFEHNVIVRPTAFVPNVSDEPDARRQFHELYDELITDNARNQVICADIVQATKEGRSPVVLTERRAHLELLEKRLSREFRHLVVLRGGLRERELTAIKSRLAAIPDHEERVLLATGRYIGEGFDDARLDSLFLTLPVSWRGTIAQYAGRLHRRHEHKREVRVYDYADLNVPMLAKMFDRRCKGYEAVGYKVLLPASAVPGWPADVLLPVDRNWKEDYAASVRRLARDGVDNSLADLFVHVARTVTPDAEGVDRARSASEAFLYRRLQTLPETTGQFRLNAVLPISFDGRGSMEVDFLCDDARLVVELDGAQHLSDADAYRRDRRKDMLLQEHGYTVLRFLAEDVGQRLDTVLDAILRTLAHQRATPNGTYLRPKSSERCGASRRSLP